MTPATPAGRPVTQTSTTFQTEHASGNEVIVHPIPNLRCRDSSGDRCTSRLTTALSRWRDFLPKMTLGAGEYSQQELGSGAEK